MMEPVFIGLGSNLDDPKHQLTLAIEKIKQLPQTRWLVCSQFYWTPPFGPVQEQPDFLNAVAKVESSLEPELFLQHLLSIENNMGRVRDESLPKGPRTIDLDLLLYGDREHQSPTLILPHPGILLRDFVLKPLREIAPELPLFELLEPSDCA